MTEQALSVLGRAVFATSRGLTAAGNGVLAGAGRGIGVFEFRGRAGLSSLLSHASLQSPAMFCRRAEVAVSRTSQIVLVGALKACRDNQARPGFYGACVAVPLDTRPPFFNWTSCRDEIRQLFAKVQGQADQESGPRRFAGDRIVLPSPRDERLKWSTGQGEVLLLHSDGTALSDSETLTRLQAVAFTEGHRYSTAVALESAVPQSRPLTADIVTAAMARWRAAAAGPELESMGPRP